MLYRFQFSIQIFLIWNLNNNPIPNIQEVGGISLNPIDQDITTPELNFSQQGFGDFMLLEKGFHLDMLVRNKLKPHHSTSPMKASLTRFQKLVWLGEATK